MDMAQLNYFKVTAQYKTFTKAAEALHISQPALSKSISRLESEIGAPLFDRGGGTLQLSSVGRSFLFWCNQALTAIDSGLREAKDINGVGGGEVRVAISEAIFIKHLVKDYLLQHKNVRFQSYLLNPEQMKSGISEGAIDFAISRGVIHGPDIFWRPVYNDSLTVLMSQNHRLAKKPHVRLEELSDEFFIMGDLNYDMSSFVYQYCHEAGFDPRVRYEGHESDVASIIHSLEDSVMLAFVSTTLGVRADAVGATDVVAVPVLDKQESEPIGLVFRSNRYQSAAVQQFYEMVERYYISLSGETLM